MSESEKPKIIMSNRVKSIRSTEYAVKCMRNIATIVLALLLVSCSMNALEKEKRPLLVVYDYGMGGVWLLIDARSAQEIEKKYPKLKAYDDKPEWMSNSEKAEYIQDIERIEYHWDIDEKPTGWLADL